MKIIIPFICLLISFSVHAQEEVSDDLLKEFELDVSELQLDAPSGDETFSNPIEPTHESEVSGVSEPLIPDIEPAPEVAIEPELLEDPPPSSRDTSFAVRGLMADNSSQDQINVEGKPFQSRKGHWIATVGFETTQYNLPFDFVGAKKTFKEEQRRLSGGRLGFGRETYLGGGFLLGARLEGYYMGTLFNSLETASPEFEDVTVASTKDTGQIFGGDGIVHLGWMFDYKTRNPFLGDMTYLALELFVEAGIGRGQAINGKSYFFKSTTNEQYKVTIEDDFSSQIVSAGFNILSLNSGAFLYVKASQVSQSITERKIRGSEGAIATPSEINQTLTNPESDPLTVLAIGGGFKF